MLWYGIVAALNLQIIKSLLFPIVPNKLVSPLKEIATGSLEDIIEVSIFL